MISVFSLFQFMFLVFDLSVLSSPYQGGIMPLAPDLKASLIAGVVNSMAPKDQLEENIGRTLVGNMVNQSVVNAQAGSIAMTESLIESLAKLEAMGYDKDSDLAKALIANSNAIQATLNDVSNKMKTYV
jgi:hypothetical protein